MEITRAGTKPSAKGPSNYFTGSVRVDALFAPTATTRAHGALVTFDTGSRTNWHTHPLGQTLFVTAGCGSVQREGGPVETIRPGDVVVFPAGEKHWHGATATTGMTHLAVTEEQGGEVADWLEPVSDDQFRA